MQRNTQNATPNSIGSNYTVCLGKVFSLQHQFVRYCKENAGPCYAICPPAMGIRVIRLVAVPGMIEISGAAGVN